MIFSLSPVSFDLNLQLEQALSGSQEMCSMDGKILSMAQKK